MECYFISEALPHVLVGMSLPMLHKRKEYTGVLKKDTEAATSSELATLTIMNRYARAHLWATK